MLRRDGLKIIQEQITNEPVIANLGPSTFDLHSSGDRDANLYTWGAMWLVSSIGLGVAISAPQTKVIVTDGDGSLLMNLGSLATIARQSPKNLIHGPYLYLPVLGPYPTQNPCTFEGSLQSGAPSLLAG